MYTVCASCDSIDEKHILMPCCHKKASNLQATVRRPVRTTTYTLRSCKLIDQPVLQVRLTQNLTSGLACTVRRLRWDYMLRDEQLSQSTVHSNVSETSDPKRCAIYCVHFSTVDIMSRPKHTGSKNTGCRGFLRPSLNWIAAIKSVHSVLTVRSTSFKTPLQQQLNRPHAVVCSRRFETRSLAVGYLPH